MLITATLLATTLFGQIPVEQGVGFGHAVVRGTVRDSVSAALPNTIVYATSETSVATAVTDANGSFYFLTLLPGNYSITASKQGYTSQGICLGEPDQPRALGAGLEYTVTILLASSCK